NHGVLGGADRRDRDDYWHVHRDRRDQRPLLSYRGYGELSPHARQGTRRLRHFGGRRRGRPDERGHPRRRDLPRRFRPVVIHRHAGGLHRAEHGRSGPGIGGLPALDPPGVAHRRAPRERHRGLGGADRRDRAHDGHLHRDRGDQRRLRPQQRRRELSAHARERAGPA